MDSRISKKAFLFSAGLHLFVLLLLIISLAFSEPMPVVSNNDSKIIQAIALEDSPILAPPTKATENPQPEVKEPPLVKQEAQPAEAKSSSSKPKKAEEAAKAPSTPEKIALPDDKKKSEAQPKKLVRKDLSKQLLADLEDEIAKKGKAKHKLIKDKFRRELKVQSEKSMRQLLKEHKQLTGQRSQHRQGVINKYKAQILQAIAQQWVIPSHVDKNLYCELLIRLDPGGVVLEVTVTRSSGDVILDRSAQAAVFKASPLPVPNDILSFEPFRHFVLKVKPENILENKGDQGFWIS